MKVVLVIVAPLRVPAVKLPVANTLNTELLPTCRLMKSPVKVAGLAPRYVPLTLPPLRARPRRIDELVAEPVGAPLRTNASLAELKVLLPLKVWLALSLARFESLDKAAEEIWTPLSWKLPPTLLMLLAQAKAPVALVTVQPVLPEPPPRRMSPVLVAPILMVLVPLASTVRAPVPEIAVPDTLSELTAEAVSVPPDTLPPLRVPPEMVAVL